VAQAGGTVYFEPACIVTYVPGPPLELTDIHFYMLRWSDAWTVGSLNRIREKWDLAEDGYFQSKYKKLGWRRRGTIVKPLTRRLSFGFENKPLKKILGSMDRYSTVISPIAMLKTTFRVSKSKHQYRATNLQQKNYRGFDHTNVETC
jgi:hypothetical protein